MIYCILETRRTVHRKDDIMEQLNDEIKTITRLQDEIKLKLLRESPSADDDYIILATIWFSGLRNDGKTWGEMQREVQRFLTYYRLAVEESEKEAREKNENTDQHNA